MGTRFTFLLFAPMSQPHEHFLCAIADKAWQKSPGSFILVSLGGVARAVFQQQHELLKAQPGAAALNLAGRELTDFSVRQVTLDMMDVLSGGVVTRLSKTATKEPHPVAIPGEHMKYVLTLTDEYDELRATRLALLPDGTLEVSVAVEQVHNGRSFVVKGAIDLKKLLAPALA